MALQKIMNRMALLAKQPNVYAVRQVHSRSPHNMLPRHITPNISTAQSTTSTNNYFTPKEYKMIPVYDGGVFNTYLNAQYTEDLQEYLNDNWKLYGNPAANGFTIYQALVK